MKKFGLFFVSALALLTIAACSDDEDEINKEENYDDSYYAAQATVTSSDANFTATSDGGTINFKTEGGTVTLNVSCGCDWTVDNEATDLFTTSVTSATLTVTAEQNTVEEELTGTVIVKTSNEGVEFATITIIQAAYGAPEISVETTEWNAPAKGTLTTEISVEATADWTAESADAWLTVVKTDTGITLTADENGETTERSTKVTITCTDDVSTVYDYVTVNQDALAYITLSFENLEFEDPASSDEVEVTSNYDWDYSYDTSNGWFTVTSDGNTLTVSVEANEETEEREGVVTLSAGDGAENVAETQLTIVQAGKANTDMILTFTIDSANSEVHLPFDSESDCYVDWGDGSAVAHAYGSYPTHIYESAGEYDVTISGYVPSLTSYDYRTNADAIPLSAVKQWGDTGLTSMEAAFYGRTKLASLPENTGDALANVTTFKQAFYNCSSLTKLPDGLFKNCTEATTFSYCFYGSAFETVPEDLFEGCTGVETFEELFNQNGNLKTVPAGLFSSSPKNTSFYYTFANCKGLTSIPSGLFDNCPLVETFYYCFYHCDEVTEIPEGLFDNCPEVTTFRGCFYYCGKLTSFPKGLFSKNLKVTSFQYTLRNCTSATGESPYDEIDGVKVHLYERENYPEIYATLTEHAQCFGSDTGLSDYESIPSGWK